MLLTRLPVAVLSTANPSPAACVWMFPIVGLVVGGVGALVYTVVSLVASTALAAIVAVAGTVFVTGGLHEDGLADMADGFGGGSTTDRKLAIMRDSRIGSYGALALILTVGARVTAIAGSSNPVVAMVVSGVLGRGVIVAVLGLLRPARPDGLAASLGETGQPNIVAGLALAACCSLLAPLAVLAAAAIALGVAWLARRQVGGYTGDILGGAEQLGECAALIAMG